MAAASSRYRGSAQLRRVTPSRSVLTSVPMFFRDWWRIETDFGSVMLELDGADGAGGGVGADSVGADSAGASDRSETERLLNVLTYGIECRNPRISVAILEVYARRHSIDFTPGTSLDSVPPGAMDHLRPTLIDFLKTEVGAGAIRLREARVPTRKRERTIKFAFAPQPTTREELTFIGVEVKDQDDVPVAGTRVRFELPDGDIKVATTNSEGIARIDGLALPGNAKISLLDFNEPGNAEPVEQDEVVEPPPAPPLEPEEQPEPKEFTVKIVDETGKGVAGIPMVFSGAGTSETVPTDASGVAKWKAATESVDVTFESAESVNQAMKAVWQSRAATPLDAYFAEGSDVVAVTSRASAVEALSGDLFNSLSVAAAQPKTLSIRPAKRRAVLIEMHDTLFRTGSAVVNPEGEAPSTAVGEHESITTVGLIATILRYNEEHEGKKLFIAGHADRAGDDAGNVKLSEHRAKAVLALVEGKKDDYIAACGAKHSEVDVTQLFDWVNRQFGFTCKPTVMDRAPSDENYVKFRKSFNLWVKNGPAEGEKEPRGTKIGDYGRLQPDIWEAMFDLYEYNLRDELGEDSDGGATLRQGLTWVDGDKKTVGFGEKHPTTENAVDGMRSQADRRVEVMFFDGGEEPDLAGNNGEDIYDGVTFERRRVEAMTSAKPAAVVSLDVGAATPWSDSARVTLIAENGTVISDQTVTAGEISGARRMYRFRGRTSNTVCRIAVLEKNTAYYLSDWLILSGASLVSAPPGAGGQPLAGLEDLDPSLAVA